MQHAIARLNSAKPSSAETHDACNLETTEAKWKDNKHPVPAPMAEERRRGMGLLLQGAYKKQASRTTEALAKRVFESHQESHKMPQCTLENWEKRLPRGLAGKWRGDRSHQNFCHVFHTAGFRGRKAAGTLQLGTPRVSRLERLLGGSQVQTSQPRQWSLKAPLCLMPVVLLHPNESYLGTAHSFTLKLQPLALSTSMRLQKSALR